MTAVRRRMARADPQRRAVGELQLDDAGLLVWADQRFEKIRKCAECGDPIYDDKKAFYPEGCHGDDDFLCCRDI